MIPSILLLTSFAAWLWTESKASQGWRILLGLFCLLALAVNLAIVIHNQNGHLVFHRMALRHLAQLLEDGQLDKRRQLDVQRVLHSYDELAQSDGMSVATLTLVNEMRAIPLEK
jgi:hypothetical protein